MVLLPVATAQGIHNVPDLLNNLGVPDPLWDAFTATAGDPANDVRLIAAMPVWTIPQILGAALLASGERIPYRLLKWGWCGAMRGG